MLHGNPTWSFYFRDLINGLRDRFRVIAPDHMGCGLSSKPQVYPYTLTTHIQNLEKLLDRLDVDNVTLAVHDWGGPIGFGWAIRHPRKVRRFVIFNTAAFLGGRLPWRIRLCRWPMLGDLIVRGLNGFARAAIYMASAQTSRMTPDVRHGYLMPYDSPSHRIAIHRFIQDIPLRPTAASYAVLGQIQLALGQFHDRPITIIWGMKDFCFTERFLDEWVMRFPKADVHRLENAGHYVVEDAHEHIVPIMQEVLG